MLAVQGELSGYFASAQVRRSTRWQGEQEIGGQVGSRGPEVLLALPPLLLEAIEEEALREHATKALRYA